MGYVISAGVGLAVGVGFLVFALVERSRRRSAEIARDEANQRFDDCRRIADQNIEKAQLLEEDFSRLARRENALRAALKEAEDRLIACSDPKAVKDWLTSVLKGGTLVLALFIASCCTPCKPLPAVLVPVTKPCALPPAIELPEVTPSANCPAEFYCLDTENTKRLALREQRMQNWIREVRAACAPLAASRPAESK